MRLAFLPILIACFALLPSAQATDLDGVLPNGNTADGSGVLVNLNGGVWNLFDEATDLQVEPP